VVEKAEVETRPIYRRDQGKVEELAARDAGVTAAIAGWHQGTVAWVEEPVGATDSAVHSYFVWAGYDPASALVNAAQSWYARPLLASAGFAELPILSSVAPFRAGYTPDSFIDFAAGAIPLRAVADLYMYSNNTVTAVKVTGAQILEWLEFSARIFNTIDPAAAEPQALINKRLPSYNFDIIAGLTYKIDVTQPPRYDARGALNPQNRRIADLRFDGQPIGLDREFAVVTNSYRADGGGNFPALKGANVILRAPDTNRDAIVRYFRASATVAVPRAFPWQFAPAARATSVYFDTGKAAASHLSDAPGLIAMGEGEPGYMRMGLTL
jgi:2',3'-cyclic-nucleotide 2'-phosphodiesterase/3'-nucleotidase